MSTKTIIDVIVILKERLANLAPNADAKTVAYIVSSIEKLELQVSAMMLIEFGDEQVEALKTESATGLLLIANMLAIEGAALKALVQGSAKSLKALAVEKTLAFEAFSKQSAQDQIDLINQAGQALINQPQGGILTQANPILFGVMKRYDCMGMGYTSEYGQFHGGNPHKPFEALTGINQDRRFKNFEVPLGMQFIKGDNWGFQEQKTEYACSGAIYQYPSYMVSATFLKNSSDNDINKTFKSNCSNYWSSGYEGIQINQADPTYSDGIATGLNWKQLATNTSSSVNRDTSATITIPANSTVAVVLSNARHYQTNSNGYQFYYQHEVSGFNDILDDNISIDHTVTQNALQLNTTNAFEFWNTHS